MVVSKANIFAKKGNVTCDLKACNELILEDEIYVISFELAMQSFKKFRTTSSNLKGPDFTSARTNCTSGLESRKGVTI